jgi:hypothetical protein
VRSAQTGQQDGELFLTVGGHATGVIRAHRLRHLVIGDYFAGHLIAFRLAPSYIPPNLIGLVQIGSYLKGTITAEELSGSQIRVLGAVHLNSAIVINDIVQAETCGAGQCLPTIELNAVSGDTFGDISINDHLSFDGLIVIRGKLQSPGAIKMNNHIVFGRIELQRGGSGNLLGISGVAPFYSDNAAVVLGATSEDEFSGHAVIFDTACFAQPFYNCAVVSAGKLTGTLTLKSPF